MVARHEKEHLSCFLLDVVGVDLVGLRTDAVDGVRGVVFARACDAADRPRS